MIKVKRRKHSGFTLSEVMISTSIFSAVSMGLLMGLVSLERNFAATTDFATKHADQERLSDYLALDLRRAVAVNAATNDITIPIYYDTTNKNPLQPAVDAAGDIFYTATDMSGKTILAGSGPPTSLIPINSTDGNYYLDQTAYAVYGPKTLGLWGLGTPLRVTIHYSLQGATILRQQGSDSPIPVAENVKNFIFVLNPADLGKTMTTTITFNPTFVSSDTSTATFYNKTLLRNINIY
jgi:prepilin-type N-terminal cleavage/methylation domain-containing protein